ncbi:MAG: alkaline phosphatase D family protein [Pseudomonadota bacterium]
MKRRKFIGLIAGGAVAGYLNLGPRPAGASEARVFRHGVASGDPLADAVILWTRVSEQGKRRVRVKWSVALDPEFRQVVRRGRRRTGPDRDYTVKIDVTGLEAGRTYYYRFTVDGETSPVGRTRTLPVGQLESARFAVVSCSNYAYGYFNVYRDIAAADELDAVIHLGDYMYEHGQGGYATEYAEALGRVPVPPVETVTLADYRARYAQYKSDPDSQAMLARIPLISVWDDHEITNDAWRDGAHNHQEEEGSYRDRVAAAVQAYFEWMPIRGEAAAGATRIFRSFDYGDLLSLHMLDTRLYDRDAQPDVDGETDPQVIAARLKDPSRRLLGREQEGWFGAQVEESAATWQLIGQQVMMAPVRSPDLEPLLDLDVDSGLPREALEQYVAVSKNNPPMLLDTWNGYPAARQDFLATLADNAANAVVLTGDMHTSMAGNLIPAGREAPVAVELMTTSVTSPGFDDYLPQVRPNAVRDATLDCNDMLSYMETGRRGWLCVQLTRSECTAEWHLIDTVHSREYSKTVDCRLRVEAGRVGEGLQEAS